MIGLITLIVLFAFSFIGPIFSPWEETEVDYSIPEKKRENYLTTNYVEQLDPNDLFVNGDLFACNPLSGVDYDEDTGIGNYYRDGKQIWFKVEPGANKAVFVSDENGNKIMHYVIEYSWDRKTFNQLGKVEAKHWLGTDEYGMDVFTRLMYGGRISLTLGFVVIILETIFGVILGGLAGYFGKWVDQVIMRIVDIFNCVPQFPILLILSAVLDSMDIEANMKIYYLMGIMTILGWAGIARVVRGQILFLREQEYMVAAEALGLSVPRKIFRHLLPNVLPQLIVQMTLGLGGLILTESTLSYLGIGIPIPGAAWGTMISAAQKPEILQGYPNLWVPAGILIVLAVLAFNFVGDGLRDAFDPKASR
ncbi:MAG: ABC transporter permease [Clostridia bacterium]|nr:ABC transporter permease [Clostridia bacterium]